MKKCLRVECENEFEPTKPKQLYCSGKCRTYDYRKKLKKDVGVKNLNEPTNKVEPPKQPTTNFVVNTERIAELEAELPTIPENTVLGKRRRAWIQNEIYKLKYPKQ